MAKLNVAQTAFSAGELSPGMYGRSDLREHSEGAKTISNFIVRPQGGLTRRPGSIFAGATLADDQTRLIPFPVGERRFVVEMGDLFLRFWEEIDGTLALVPTSQDYVFPPVTNPVWDTAGLLSWNFLMDRKDIPLATGMGPYAISTTGSLPAGSGLAAQSPNLYLSVTTIAGTSTSRNEYNYDANISPVEVRFWDSYADATGVTGGSGAVNLNTGNGTGTHTLTTQNPGFLTTTHTSAGDKIRWARSDAELWITSTETASPFSVNVYKIRYFEKLQSNAYFGQSDVGEGHIEVEWINGAGDGPFHTISNTSEFSEDLEWNEVAANPLTTIFEVFTLTQPNVGHGATWETGVTVEEALTIVPGKGLVYGRERVLGSSDSLGEVTNWGVGALDINIAEEGEMVRPFTRAATRIDTDLYAFGPMFTETEPWRAVELFQGRICLAGGVRAGTVSFGSLERRFLFIPADIDGEITGATSFQLSIPNDQDLRVNSMVATQNKLFVITRQGVYSFAPVSGLFNAASFNSLAVNRIPGKDAQGISFGDFAGYITADGRHIMAVDVNNEGVKFNTFDLTRFSDHILEPGAHTLAHQRIPGSLIWSVLDDGAMASITFSREEGIIAAASQSVAGDTVEVEDAISMPFHDGTEVVYLSVKRDINSVTKRYIERINAIPEYSTAIEDYVLLDSAGIYDSSAVTNVPATTFDHLNGETVDVYADGVHVGTKVISGGQFTVALTTAASKIYAGYKYNSDVEMFRPTESFPAFGTTEGSLKRNIAVVTQFSNTYGGQAGSSADDLEPIQYESDTPSLITDELETPIEDESKRDATLLIRANQPYPMDITSVIRRIDFEARGGE